MDKLVAGGVGSGRDAAGGIARSRGVWAEWASAVVARRALSMAATVEAEGAPNWPPWQGMGTAPSADPWHLARVGCRESGGATALAGAARRYPTTEPGPPGMAAWLRVRHGPGFGVGGPHTRTAGGVAPKVVEAAAGGERVARRPGRSPWWRRDGTAARASRARTRLLGLPRHNVMAEDAAAQPSRPSAVRSRAGRLPRPVMAAERDAVESQRRTSVGRGLRWERLHGLGCPERGYWSWIVLRGAGSEARVVGMKEWQ